MTDPVKRGVWVYKNEPFSHIVDYSLQIRFFAADTEGTTRTRLLRAGFVSGGEGYIADVTQWPTLRAFVMLGGEESPSGKWVYMELTNEEIFTLLHNDREGV